MIVFPAIDLIDGKCVRLTEGKFDTLKEYSADPLDIAKKYEDAGLSHLHLVDLDGARNKKVSQYKILEAISTKTNLNIDFGGGIQSEEDIKIVFESGAAQANVGSLAVTKPEIFTHWLEIYGAENISLASDVKDKMIAAHAWKDISKTSIFQLIDQFVPAGLKHVTCTDISKDGMLQGVNQDLDKELIDTYPDLFITASGGVHNMDDLFTLKKIKCKGVIIGKAIYENRISLRELYEIQNN